MSLEGTNSAREVDYMNELIRVYMNYGFYLLSCRKLNSNLILKWEWRLIDRQNDENIACRECISVK